MANKSKEALFESRKEKGSLVYKLLATSILVGIILIWFYRAASFPENGGLVWIGMFCAEIWFGFYWILTQALRWNRIHRKTFKNRLSQRYGKDLPGVDIFVCTADPTIEPPMMVMNTVLSVMAYDYPPEKLSVYLSDDGGSDLTFYALVEASRFAQHWIPFCRKFGVEPPSPDAYFRSESHKLEPHQSSASIKGKYVIFKLLQKGILDRFIGKTGIFVNSHVTKLYDEMEKRIEVATKVGRIPESAVLEQRGFYNWDSDSFGSTKDHATILQIVIDENAEVRDIEGCRLPRLVYLAREKRPLHFHNFKAGAMNALIRVSSEISNAPVILNVDCDMYSNNSQSIKDALCFFLDEEAGHDVAFVQFPQNFHNVTKNELYGSLRIISEVEFHGLDGNGGPMYIGTGCFNRRDTLCGRKLSKGSRFEWKEIDERRRGESVIELEERVKILASSTFEKNTQWGHEMGLKYGCPVEDVITGLSIQCRGWKSIYYNPERKGFLGVATTTLEQTLVQHKRWSEGDLQILLSKYSPVWYGVGKINFGLIMGYCAYCTWSLNCFATLYYSTVPSLYLLNGVSLFPQVSSMWVVPFMYVLIAEHVYSFTEYLCAGGTALGWWNEQRIWLYKRTSSYLFAVTDTLLKFVWNSDSGFVISAKVSDEDVLERYEQEKMEFGRDSPMFVVLSSPAMLNLECLVAIATRVIFQGLNFFDQNLALQIVLCGALVMINLPLYNAAFVRKDKGRLPNSVTFKSTFMSLTLCALYFFT